MEKDSGPAQATSDGGVLWGRGAEARRWHIMDIYTAFIFTSPIHTITSCPLSFSEVLVGKSTDIFSVFISFSAFLLQTGFHWLLYHCTDFILLLPWPLSTDNFHTLPPQLQCAARLYPPPSVSSHTLCRNLLTLFMSWLTLLS